MYRLRRSLLRTLVPEWYWSKTVTLDGVRIPVRGMPYSFGVKHVLTKGNYEADERALLKEVISEGDQVVELGGSIGILAGIMSEKVSAFGRVVCVEASDRLTQHSRAWLEPKGNVKILTGIGFPVCRVPEKYMSLSFLDDGNSLGGTVNFQLEECERPSVPSHEIYDLDTISAKTGIQPNILVIDIEGSEIVLQEPDVKIPDSVQHIVIEMHPGIYGLDTEKLIIDRIEKLGLKVIKEMSHVFLLSRSKQTNS